MSAYVLAMRFALSVLTALALTAPSLAEECKYFAGDGGSVTIHENSTLTIHGSDGTEVTCDIHHTEFQTVKWYSCGSFEGDLYMMPSRLGQDFPDIIFMPPNPMYFHCATPA